MVELPISVTTPAFVSAEQMTAAMGSAGGMLFGEFMSSLVLAATNLTGTAALVTSMFLKGATSFGMFWLAGRMVGGARTAMWMASAGALAGIIIDFIRTVRPGGAGAVGAEIGARIRGAAGVPGIRVVGLAPSVGAAAPVGGGQEIVIAPTEEPVLIA